MWGFKKLGNDDKRSGKKLSEFFNAQKDSASIVRESIQNSLDASLNLENDDCVKINYKFITVKKEILASYLETEDTNDLLEHCSSPDLKKYKFVGLADEVTCLVIEDFGTSGLTGPTDHRIAKNTGNFIGFWWTEGISGKGKGSTGSHGVGKSVFSSSSLIYSFFALTHRNDDKKTFLIGYCGLPYHTLDNNSFEGEGRFGARKNGYLEPIQENEDIQKFKKDFFLERNDSDSGLSIMIPCIRDDVSSEDIIESISEEYYMAIINGRLEVSITREDGKILKLNKNNFLEVSQTTKNKDIKELAFEAVEMRNNPNSRFFSGISPVQTENILKIKQNSFTDENLKKIREYFNDGEMVAIQVPLEIIQKDRGKLLSRVDVFLKNDPNKALRIDQYVRNNIVISGENSSIMSPFTFAMLIADDEEISEYLRHAEEPSHRHWFQYRLKKEKIYNDDSVLKFIKMVVKQLYQILSGIDEDEKELKGVASDIFSIDEPIDEGAKKKIRRKKKNDDGEINPPPPPIQRKKNLLNIGYSERRQGIKITASSDLSDLVESNEIKFPLDFIMHLAYTIPLRTGNQSIRAYEKQDFSLSKGGELVLDYEGNCEINDSVDNVLKFKVHGKDFGINISGFDGVRDVTSRCKLLSAFVSEEEI